MKNLIITTSDNWGITALRIVLGIVIFAHGAQAMLGWFGGPGISVTLQALTSYMGLPWIVALAVICIQFFGSIMLIAGAGTRVAAAGTIGIFIGMITYHVEHGFFMNWYGTNSGEGFEYHILVLGMSLTLLITGGGAFSIDRKILGYTPS
jgi:putative oxidoreductase